MHCIKTIFLTSFLYSHLLHGLFRGLLGKRHKDYGLNLEMTFTCLEERCGVELLFASMASLILGFHHLSWCFLVLLRAGFLATRFLSFGHQLRRVVLERLALRFLAEFACLHRFV